MDIRYTNNDFQFIYRTSSVIFNQDKTKILLFNVKGREIFLLPGGKVHQEEDTLTALKREIKEELGYTDLDFQFLAFSEEFNKHNCNNHQVNAIYYTTINESIQKETFDGKEGDWCEFNWVDIKDLDKYNVYPSQIKTVLNDLNQIYHFVTRYE